MFGIPDPLVALAYLLCILSALLCVLWSWRNWNRGGDKLEPEDVRWEAEDKKVEENL